MGISVYDFKGGGVVILDAMTMELVIENSIMTSLFLALFFIINKNGFFQFFWISLFFNLQLLSTYQEIIKRRVFSKDFLRRSRGSNPLKNCKGKERNEEEEEKK